MFIVLEGIDGSGKTSQSSRLSEWLTKRTGHETIRTYEPGGWDGGGKFRSYLLTQTGISAKTEILLYLSDRSEHVRRIIEPNLRHSRNVICERYNASTLVYQTLSGELDFAQALNLIKACEFPEPLVSIILDVKPETAMERISRRSSQPDKYEMRGLEFLRKASEFYHKVKESAPEKYELISCGNMDEDGIFLTITRYLESKI